MKRDYPDRPLVGVGAIILQLHPLPQVVLVKRRNPPLQGEWTIPGGVLELGEELEAGACREAREETGLIVRPSGGFEVFDRILRDPAGVIEFHYVLIDYLCEVVGGELRAGGDVEAAKWFRSEDLGSPGVSDFTADIVRRVFARLSV